MFSTAGYTEPYEEAPLSHGPPNFQQPVLGQDGCLMG